MGDCMDCCERAAEDPEAEICEDLESLINLLKTRKQNYLKEKSDIVEYMKTGKPVGKANPYASPDELEEEEEDTVKISQEIDRCIDILNKFENKVELKDAKKLVRRINDFASKRDLLGITNQINEFESYLIELN